MPRWPMTGMPTFVIAVTSVDHRRAPFQFHRMGSDLKKAPGIAKRLLLADLIGEKRHVADDQ